MGFEIDPGWSPSGRPTPTAHPSSSDYSAPAFSNCGTADRHVDLVAPGVSIVNLRNPGSYAYTNDPSRVGEFFFRGTGTSQAAAVVSGAAAVLLSIARYRTADFERRTDGRRSLYHPCLLSKQLEHPCRGN